MCTGSSRLLGRSLAMRSSKEAAREASTAYTPEPSMSWYQSSEIRLVFFECSMNAGLKVLGWWLWGFMGWELSSVAGC